MSEHRAAGEPSLPRKEPPAVAELVRLLLLGAVGAGWLTLDSDTVTIIVSAVGVLVSIVLTWVARSKVTPEAKPRTDDGTPLVPAAPPTTLGRPPEPH